MGIRTVHVTSYCKVTKVAREQLQSPVRVEALEWHRNSSCHQSVYNSKVTLEQILSPINTQLLKQ